MKRKPQWPMFRGLTRAQIRAFERVAFCSPPSCADRTIEALVARGLVIKTMLSEQTCHGVFTCPSYSVPFEQHMSWCLWYGDDGADAVMR